MSDDPKVTAVTIGFPEAISYERWQRFLHAVMEEVEREGCLVNIRVYYPEEPQPAHATIPSLPAGCVCHTVNGMWTTNPYCSFHGNPPHHFGIPSAG